MNDPVALRAIVAVSDAATARERAAAIASGAKMLAGVRAVAVLVDADGPIVASDPAEADLADRVRRSDTWKHAIALRSASDGDGFRFVPVRTDAVALGLIALESPRALADETARLVAAFADAVAHVILALSNARLYQRERGRRARAEALERIVRVLRGAHAVDDVLSIFVVAASDEFPVDVAAFSLRGDDLVRRAARVRTAASPPMPTHLRLRDLEGIADSDEAFDAADLPQTIRAELFQKRPGTVVPLKIDGRLWGVVVFREDAAGSRWAGEDRASMLRVLGSHVELALSSAQAFARELVRAQERATLAEAARTILSHTALHPLADVMCRLAAGLVHAESACAVRVRDDRLETIGTFGSDAAQLVRTFARNRPPALLPTLDAGKERRQVRIIEGEGFAAVPLRQAPLATGGEEHVGGYLVTSVQAGRRLDRDGLRLLDELGALFALALRNLELYESTTRANAALRESSEFKDDLIAMLAHDFKSPLTVILGYCELLQESRTDHSLELGAISSQAQRLLRLSEDALVLARTQAEGFSLDRANANFGAFVKESTASVAGSSDRVRTIVDDAHLVVSMDSQRFRHVIDNLISNALKYSAGEVRVRVRRSGEWALLEVSDDGIGIPTAELETIFSRFGRASNARELGVAGSGVGLYVSRKIVEVHRGSMKAASSPGKGSTFTVTLPLSSP